MNNIIIIENVTICKYAEKGFWTKIINNNTNNVQTYINCSTINNKHSKTHLKNLNPRG